MANDVDRVRAARLDCGDRRLVLAALLEAVHGAVVIPARAAWIGEAGERYAGLLLFGAAHPCVDVVLTGIPSAEEKNSRAHFGLILRQEWPRPLLCPLRKYGA